MNELALFAGAGGGILGGRLLGWRTVCAVEIDAYARRVLAARQDDGSLEPFPIWDDVRTFDGRPWRGVVDVVSGGFPCQDISVAGKGAGIDGARSGLWAEMARIVREVEPSYVLVENSPMLTSRGLGRVLGDLAAMGYDASWGVLGAHHAGAPHRRDRLWIVANAQRVRQSPPRNPEINRTKTPSREANKPGGGSEVSALAHAESICERKSADETDAVEISREARYEPMCGGKLRKVVADTDRAGLEEQRCAFANGEKHEAAECGGWWAAEPDVGRVAHGVANRVDRLRALGNGQVPAVVRLAWRTLAPEAAQTLNPGRG